MTIGYNPFDEDFSLEDLHEYRAMAISLREENLRLKKNLKEYKDKIEQGTLKEEKTCENVSEMNPVDGFTCSECGITIIDFREEKVDEDYNASWYEYEIKYCPNCGAKVVNNG